MSTVFAAVARSTRRKRDAPRWIQVRAAEAARDGGRATIPVGRLSAGNGEVNTGWSWHVDDITFAEAAIELCDAMPSYVESIGPSFGNGQYCPWSARVLSIESVS